MPYDLQAARQAGANDDQILGYLAQNQNYDVDGAIKAGANKQQVLSYLAQNDGTAAATPPHAGPWASGYVAPQAPSPKTVSGFLGNVASSGYNLAKNAINTAVGGVEKPLRTGVNLITGGATPPSAEEQQFDNIGDTVAGLAHQGFKTIGLGGAVDETPEAKSDIAKAEAFENNYKQRYGGLKNIGDTLYNDPAGVAADAAMLTGGISGAAGKTSELAEAINLPRAAAGLRAVKAGAELATETNPIVAIPKAIPPAFRTAKQLIQDRVDRVGDPHLTLTQSLKPMASRVNFDRSVATAMPDIKAAEANAGDIQDVGSLLDAVKVAKRANRAQFEQFTTPAQRMRMQVDLNPVADAMEASIPETVKFENTTPDGTPTGAHQAAIDNANAYRTAVPIEKAEAMLRDTNAALDSYYAKYPGIKRAQLRANPETSALVAKADALRDSLYSALDDPGLGAGPRELNRRYGALTDIEDAAMRRKNVADRQQPESLQQQLSKAQAIGHAVKGGVRLLSGNPAGALDIVQGAAGRAASNFLKEQQTTNNLIRRSFKNYSIAPGAVAPPLAPNIRGLLGPASIITPPPADASFVRGVPAMTQPPNPARALPPASTRFAGPIPDQSGVRGVPAQPGFSIDFPQKALPPATSMPRGRRTIGSQYGDILNDPLDLQQYIDLDK